MRGLIDTVFAVYNVIYKLSGTYSTLTTLGILKQWCLWASKSHRHLQNSVFIGYTYCPLYIKIYGSKPPRPRAKPEAKDGLPIITFIVLHTACSCTDLTATVTGECVDDPPQPPVCP